jgi:hypothetical protein
VSEGMKTCDIWRRITPTLGDSCRRQRNHFKCVESLKDWRVSSGCKLSGLLSTVIRVYVEVKDLLHQRIGVTVNITDNVVPDVIA